MAIKRSAEDIIPTQQGKRTRLSPAQEDPSNSSDPSDGSVSEDVALQSSRTASEHTRSSSFSSVQPLPTGNHAGSDSSTSTSSESSNSDSESDDDVVTVGGPRKPRIRRSDDADSASDLRARLVALLPQMAEANKLLAGKPDGASMEDVDEENQHIEMDLGLGVLEERNGDSTSESSESSDDDEGRTEKDVLGRLMGTHRTKEGVRIVDAS